MSYARGAGAFARSGEAVLTPTYRRPSWGLGVRDEVKARVGTQSLGDADPFGCLVILQQSRYDTR